MDAEYEPQPGDPAVLFVNIGWAERYDGSEEIQGNHTWLQEHPDDCSEMAAFAKDADGLVECWIGWGIVNVERTDIVFVARKPDENGHRVVGMYFDPIITDRSEESRASCGAYTGDYKLWKTPDRLRIEWPGRMGLRRWAYRAGGSGTEHPNLYVAYRKLLEELGRTPGDSTWNDGSLGDEEDLDARQEVEIALGENVSEGTSAEPTEFVDRQDQSFESFAHSKFFPVDAVAAEVSYYEPGQTLVQAIRNVLRRPDLDTVSLTSFASNRAFFELSGFVRLVNDGRIEPSRLRLAFAPPGGCDHDLAIWLRQQADQGRLSVREHGGLGHRVMHVKGLLVQLRDGRRVAFIGSANATFAGIASNEEYTCAFSPQRDTGAEDPFAWFERMWESGVDFVPAHFVNEEVVLRRRPLFEFQLHAQHALSKHIQPLLDEDAVSGDDSTPGGHGGALLVLPTGAGKTLTAMRWIFNHVLPDPDRGRVLWLSHRRELLQHAHDTARAELLFASGRKPNIVAYGIDDGGKPPHGPFDEGDLIFLSSQRAHRAMKKLGRRKKLSFGLVVIDEAHRASGSTKQYGELLAAIPHRARLGLTATPYRGMATDARQFSRVFTLDEHWGRNRPTVLFGKTIEELESERLPGGLSLFAKQNDVTVPTGFRYKLTADNEGDFSKYLHQFDTRGRNKKIIGTYVDRYHEGLTIIFCLNRAHANRIAAGINRAGGAAQAFHEGEIPVEATTFRLRRQGMNVYDRGRVLQEFRERRIRVLCCVQLLTEGFDLPEISTVMLARPTMSTLLMTQMIGRGLRGPAVGGSPTCDIVDFADQLEIHKKRDATARLRVARPGDAAAFRRGEPREDDAIPVDDGD